ncbi:hypothetical protein NEOLEDRAFT_1239790 [Neolentinus lepideus HHB14362 ss-1]|uniref:F-box domain-containing protein n=1 Tax=Neolentinus lepideus HHB14362 ss-1 TaxID=1314782 RepID=A0A165UEH0_9AGAM|nr:hypothetical protein NEOLEDRAFT_1239790 [Neolentinus lepideus HHB14362 ss-1]
MQAAISNRDIIHEFLNQLEIQASWKDLSLLRRQRQDLLWVALSCKAFVDPALDLLWRQIDSLTPLFSILSGFFWTGDCYVLLGSVPSYQLTRLKRYAVCVREAKISFDHRIHPSTLHRLWQLLRAPILPRLRSLTWDNGDPLALQSFFFITTSLSHIDIKTYPKTGQVGESYALAAFLDVLADQVSSLRHLKLSGRLPHYCLNALARMKELRSLDMNGCMITGGGDPPMPLVLRPFQNLSSLNIECQCMLTILTLPNCRLDHLVNLKLFGDLPSGIRILGSLAPERLLSLSVTFVLGKLEEYSIFFRKVAARFPHLRRLQAQMPSVVWWLPVQHVDFADIFEPLLSLKDMENFLLGTTDVVVPMDDQDIERLASSWPKLRSFSSTHSLHDDGRAPSIRCLSAFAKLCPSLEELELPVRLSLPQGFVYDARSRHGLRLLRLLHHPGEYVEIDGIAHILNTLFPSLDLAAMARGDVSSVTWRDIIRVMMEKRPSSTSLLQEFHASSQSSFSPWGI